MACAVLHNISVDLKQPFDINFLDEEDPNIDHPLNLQDVQNYLQVDVRNSLVQNYFANF